MHDEQGRLDFWHQAQVVVHVEPARPPAPPRIYDAHAYINAIMWISTARPACGS